MTLNVRNRGNFVLSHHRSSIVTSFFVFRTLLCFGLKNEALTKRKRRKFVQIVRGFGNYPALLLIWALFYKMIIIRFLQNDNNIFPPFSKITYNCRKRKSKIFFFYVGLSRNRFSFATFFPPKYDRHIDLIIEMFLLPKNTKKTHKKCTKKSTNKYKPEKDQFYMR